MKKILFCFVTVMIFAACVKEDASISIIEDVKTPYAVTPDEAVQLLKTVIGGESTRAISIGDIKTLRKSDFVPTTRDGDDSDIIYIVVMAGVANVTDTIQKGHLTQHIV